jgi:hypothetical protein
VCALTGMSESTYKACRRWWTARGYVAIVRPGRTRDFSPSVLRSPDDHNIRQAYVLCVPRHGKATPAPPPTSASTLTRPLSKSRRDFGRFHEREAQTSGSGRPVKTGAPRLPVLTRGKFTAITDGWWAHITAPFAQLDRRRPSARRRPLARRPPAPHSDGQRPPSRRMAALAALSLAYQRRHSAALPPARPGLPPPKLTGLHWRLVNMTRPSRRSSLGANNCAAATVTTASTTFPCRRRPELDLIAPRERGPPLPLTLGVLRLVRSQKLAGGPKRSKLRSAPSLRMKRTDEA